jgi:hypothetical protein
MSWAAADGGEARLASDVMAFGQEVGRVLSNGRIVGRAVPYAQVFASGRAVKGAVGVTAWAVLEDIALDARLDDRGLPLFSSCDDAVILLRRRCTTSAQLRSLQPRERR